MFGPSRGGPKRTNEMFFMSTGIQPDQASGLSPEKRQNELYLATQRLNATFIKENIKRAFDLRTTHLVVGILSKTEKFLCGLAAGIPLVGEDYIWESERNGKWLQDKVQEFDIGNPEHSMRKNSKFFIPTLSERQAVKDSGGAFREWRVVVLIEDQEGNRQQEIYRRLLEIGGAKIERWTIKHLQDLPVAQLKAITHIISHPNMLTNPELTDFLSHNSKTANVPVVAHIFVGDCLTKAVWPNAEMYDIRNPAVIKILCSGEKKAEMRKGRVENDSNVAVVRTYSQPITCDLEDEDTSEMAFSQPITCGLGDGGVDDKNFERLPYESNTGKVKKRLVMQTASNGETENKKKPSSEINIRNKDDDGDIEMVYERQSIRQKSFNVIKTKAKVLKERKKKNSSQTTMYQFLSPRPGPSRSRIEPSPCSSKQHEIGIVENPAQRSVDHHAKNIQEEIVVVEAAPSHGEPSSKRRKFTRLAIHDDVNSPRSPSTDLIQYIQKDNNQRKPTNNNNSLLKKSGLIKSVVVGSSISRQCSASPARLHVLKRQDSFTEDTDESSITIPLDNSHAGRIEFCNNLFSLRRCAVVGLDIGNGGSSLKNDKANEGEENLDVEPLSAAMVNNIWTSLDDGGVASIQVNEGWMFALSLIRSVVNVRRYPPVEVMYKVMAVALKDKREEVRLSAYSTVCHVIQLYQPGPSNRNYYLKFLSSTEPNKSNWELSVKEPWELLVTVVEGCMAANSQETVSVSESDITPWSERDQSVGQNGSWSLILRLIAELLDTDLKNWFEVSLERDVGIDMIGGNRPLVASVIWPAEMIEWSKRIEKLSTWYVNGVGGSLSELDLESLRKLIGLGAQVVQMKERSNQASFQNTNKNEMAIYIAREVNRINLSSDDLWTELYLLEPTWLSALVSAELLAKQTRKTSVQVPTLHSIVDTYVNTKLDIPELDPSQGKRSSSRKISSPRKPLLSQNISATPSSKKIKATIRNSFGETPLHKFCKKGDVAQITECLSTPGVDINSRDNKGWTPLHEAVNAGSIIAVEQLVNHNTNNLHKYFVCLSPKKVSSKVDLLAVGGEDMMNPFHEAVVNNNLEIVKSFFSVAGKSGFPSIQDLLSSQTGEGSVAVDLSVSTEMTNFLKGSKLAEDNKIIATKVLDSEKFSTVLHVAISKYIAANCLNSIYGVVFAWGEKKQNILDVNKVINGDSNIPVEFNKWGLGSLSDGLKTSQFGVRPRFDIFRGDIDKDKDAREYEKLLDPEKLAMSMNHPAIYQLKLMKITN